MKNEKKDSLTNLSVREIRLKAKKLSIHIYSRKNKEELVELILKDRMIVLAEEEHVVFAKVKVEDELNINSDKNFNL